MKYRHSGITVSLWHSVCETELLYSARLSHCVMLAAMYGNSSADLAKGGDHVGSMYTDTLDSIPYIRASRSTAGDSSAEDAALIRKWMEINEARRDDGEQRD